jgi:hypothetical protein
MKKQNLILGLILSGCAAAVACTSSGDDTVENTGGTGGAAGGSAGTHAGGSAGKASGGTSNGGDSGSGATPSAAGEAGAGNAGGAGGDNAAGASGAAGAPILGEAGSAGETGSVVTIPTTTLDPNAVVVPSTAPATQNHLLVAGTDYTRTEVVSITLQPAAIGDATVFSDGDTVLTSSGGLGFALERTNDFVNLMEGGKVKAEFDLHQAGTDTAPLARNKAYVGLYDASLISILNLSSGTVSRVLDMSQFNYSGDADGSADIQAGVYDPHKNIVYFLLQRIDLTSIVPPDYSLPCSAENALVVGIDSSTDAIVDLNGTADGKAFELSLVNPVTMAISSDGNTLTMLAQGCYDSGTHVKSGVETLDLTTLSSKIAYAYTGTDYLGDLIVTGTTSALLSDSGWFPLDLATGALGTAFAGAPDAATFDGTDLIGISVTGKVGAVVRYNLTSGVRTTIKSTSWSGQYDTVAGLALVP